MSKLIGGIIGFIFAGFVGAIIGVIIGHFFGKGLKPFVAKENPEQLHAIQTSFFNTTFTLIGYLAKADGHVSQEEIDQTQDLMDKMGLRADHKREAIRLFKVGAQPDFDPQQTVDAFRDICGHRIQLKQIMIVYLVNTALADGKLHSNEEIALRKIAEDLQFSSVVFEQLLKMLYAQESFSHQQYQQRSYQQHSQQQHRVNRSELVNAYNALGVSEKDSDADIKKSYRKLMSQYHPDKLMGQGVPENMIKMATEQSQEIQRAYDLIKKDRKK